MLSQQEYGMITQLNKDMEEYKIKNDTYRIKTVVSNNVGLTRYIVQKKVLWFWLLSTESEESYYFHMDDAKRSIKEIAEYKETMQITRVRADGTLYITTADFMRQPKVKEELEKLKNSGIIEEIKRNNKKN